jgi:hypothetical protein
LNGHIILTDTSITTILAPEMTYTPQNIWICNLRFTGNPFHWVAGFLCLLI